MRKFIKNISDLKIRRYYPYADERDRRYIAFGRDWKVGSDNLMREIAYVTRHTESMTHLKYILAYWYMHPHFDHEKNTEIKEWFSKTKFYKYLTEGTDDDIDLDVDTDYEFQNTLMNIAFGKTDSWDMHKLSDGEIREMFEI